MQAILGIIIITVMIIVMVMLEHTEITGTRTVLKWDLLL